jgi:hypothetical protein
MITISKELAKTNTDLGSFHEKSSHDFGSLFRSEA